MMVKKLGLIIMVILLIGSIPVVCGGAYSVVILKTQKEKLSYSIGVDIGKNFQKQEIDIDPTILVKGINDVLNNRKILLTEDEMREVFTTFQSEMQAKQTEKMAKMREKNKKEGDAFLEANKKKEGVVTLPSGLQYKELKAGDGELPKASDSVTVNYRGTLINGTEFDSSYKRGQPASFQVSGVIPGWTEALQLMKVGAKWEIYVPANLAYGEQGAGQFIEPNSTLLFEIELISINKQ